MSRLEGEAGPPQEEAAPLSPICLAFSGAGLHGFYFNGVCQYIQEQEIEVREAWGSSAGALAALSVLHKAGSEAYELAFSNYDRHRWSLPWMLWHGRDFVWDGPSGGLRRFMPTGKAEETTWLREKVNGKLHIVVTRLAGLRFERVVVNHWSSVEDLMGCIRATMTIPGITAAKPYSWRGSLWLDGGFVDQHPSTEKAVLVSTSMPVQPWAASWHRHVDIFRHLPVRMSWWHCNVSARRDMFKLGYMDAKTYFETEFEEHKVQKPLRPKARAARFVMNLVLELLQGSFMLALTAGFVWRRKQLWHRLASTRLGLAILALRGSARNAPAAPKAGIGRWLMRLGVGAEVLSIGAASFVLWCTAIDLRLDFSDHLLDFATLGKKRLLRTNSKNQLSLEDKGARKETAKDRDRPMTRRARSVPHRARRA